MGDTTTKYQEAGRAQASKLLDELERHARFLVSRIEHSGRRSRDIAGEIAELDETHRTIAALRSHYELSRSPANMVIVGRRDARASHQTTRNPVR